MQPILSQDARRNAVLHNVLRIVPTHHRQLLAGWLSALGNPPRGFPEELTAECRRWGFNGFHSAERHIFSLTLAPAPPTTTQQVHFTDSFPPGVLAYRYAAGDVGFDGKTCSKPCITYFAPGNPSFAPVTVSAHPADYPGRPQHDNYLTFITDLFYFIDYEQGKIVPAHKPQDYETAGFNPAKYNPAGISKFLATWGELMGQGLNQIGMSSPQLFAHLEFFIKSVQPIVYLTMQTDLYVQVFKATHDEQGRSELFVGGPFDNAITPQNSGNFPGISNGDVDYHITRSGNVGDGMRLPKTDDISVKFLSSARVVRGEDNGGPSMVTAPHKRGGRVVPAHRQVCDTLSLALAHADEPNLVIRAPNHQASSIVRQLLAKHQIKARFLVDYDHRDSFGPDGVLSPPPDCFFIDLQSYEIPTSPSGTSVMDKWKGVFDSHIPACAGFVALRKVPPPAVDLHAYHFYRFQSTHAYDVLVSTKKSLSRIVGDVSGTSMKFVSVPLLEITTSDSLRQAQHSDNRAKTIGPFNGLQYEVDKGLNLWYPVTTISAKDAKKLRAEFDPPAPSLSPVVRPSVPTTAPAPQQTAPIPAQHPSVATSFSFGGLTSGSSPAPSPVDLAGANFFGAPQGATFSSLAPSGSVFPSPSGGAPQPTPPGPAYKATGQVRKARQDPNLFNFGGGVVLDTPLPENYNPNGGDGPEFDPEN